MKTKTYDIVCAALASACFIVALALFAFCSSGCVASTTPAAAPTATQQTVAGAVTDALSIGLVPVLSHNPNYIPATAALGAAIDTFSGDTLTADDIDAIVAVAGARASLSTEDRQTIAALIQAAWTRYAAHYQATANAAVRPDVKLFLHAVADGIANATTAVAGAKKA